MKQLLKRLLCVVLVLTMLLQVSVFATDTGAEPEVTPEAVETLPAADYAMVNGIEIPEGWWYKALYFMVENGFMEGSNGSLNHTGTATRAEMGTMITRIVGLMDVSGMSNVSGADLSQYTDVQSGKWYVKYMATAVRYGMFNGTSDTTLSPNQAITREQAFTVIGRIFGYGDGSRSDFAHIADSDSVSSYAVPYVGALVKAGVVNGTKVNDQLLINPKGNLTRAELAQVLYNLFSKTGMIWDGNSSLVESGTILWDCAQDGADFTLDGNLVLGGKAGDVINLTNVTVTGTLTIAMRDGSQVNLSGCNINNIILLSETTVVNDTAVNNLQISGAGNASYTGDASKVEISADTSVTGTYGKVEATCANLTIGTGSVVDNLKLDCSGGVCTLDGNATKAEIKNRLYTLQGSGSVENLTVHFKDTKVNCVCANLIEELDKGITGTKVSLSSGHSVKPAAPSATIVATFSKIDTGYGYSSSGRKCTIKWYVNGTLKQTGTVRIKENSQTSFKFTCTDFQSGDATIKAVLEYEGQTVEATTKVTVSKEVYIQPFNNTIASGDYSEFEKETFVNNMGYSSPTGYLIWVNRYHTKVNIFAGSRYNWNLIHTYSVGIGAKATPTVGGQFRIAAKYPTSARWSYGSWYVDHIMMWGHGGYAFHTRARLTSNGDYFVNDVNAQVSHGCIRMNVPDVAWMHANLPTGTTIISY